MRQSNYFRLFMLLTRFSLLWFIGELLVINSVYGEPHRFSLTPFSLGAVATLPKPKALGQVQLSNHVKIPAFQVYFEAGWSDKDYETTTPKDFNLRTQLTPAHAKRIAAFYFAHQWILVPNDWQLVRANVGANGTKDIMFRPPQQQTGYIRYYNSSACVGCALYVARLFFQAADGLYQRDFDAAPHYLDSIPKIKPILIRPNIKAYRATINRQNIDGLVYFDQKLSPTGSAPVEQIEVSLPSAQADLATPLLNFWLSPRAKPTAKRRD